MWGRYRTATDYYQHARTIARRTGLRNCQFEANCGQGRVDHALGHHRDALSHHQTAIEIATDLDQPADQARAHDGLAHTHHALGDTSDARQHWYTALDILSTHNVNQPDITPASIQAHLTALDQTQPRTGR